MPQISGATVGIVTGGGYCGCVYEREFAAANLALLDVVHPESAMEAKSKQGVHGEEEKAAPAIAQPGEAKEQRERNCFVCGKDAAGDDEITISHRCGKRFHLACWRAEMHKRAPGLPVELLEGVPTEFEIRAVPFSCLACGKPYYSYNFHTLPHYQKLRSDMLKRERSQLAFQQEIEGRSWKFRSGQKDSVRTKCCDTAWNRTAGGAMAQGEIARGNTPCCFQCKKWLNFFDIYIALPDPQPLFATAALYCSGCGDYLVEEERGKVNGRCRACEANFVPDNVGAIKEIVESMPHAQIQNT